MTEILKLSFVIENEKITPNSNILKSIRNGVLSVILNNKLTLKKIENEVWRKVGLTQTKMVDYFRQIIILTYIAKIAIKILHNIKIRRY